MARPLKTVRTIYKNIGLPEDLVSRMELELYSDLEEKIPFGAMQAFFTQLLRDYFSKQEVLKIVSDNVELTADEQEAVKSLLVL